MKNIFPVFKHIFFSTSEIYYSTNTSTLTGNNNANNKAFQGDVTDNKDEDPGNDNGPSALGLTEKTNWCFHQQNERIRLKQGATKK